MDATALEEFKSLAALMQFYLTLILQTVTLATTVSAGVAAYVVKGEGEARRRSLVLVIPALLCLGLGVGFFLQVEAATELRDRLQQLAGLLRFGLAPHGRVLVGSLVLCGSLLCLTGIVLGIVAFFQFRKNDEQVVPEF